MAARATRSRTEFGVNPRSGVYHKRKDEGGIPALFYPRINPEGQSDTEIRRKILIMQK